MALIKRNTAYSVNDIVNTKFGTKLKCITAGTTSTDPLILDGTSPITDGTVVWEVQEEGTGQGLVDYAANKQYNVGDIVIYNNKIYKCKTAYTSTATFDTTKWEEISAGGLSTWQQETDYKVNDAVLYSNRLYKCIEAHTSTTTFDTTKWVIISGNDGKTTFVKLGEGDVSAQNVTMTLSDSLDNYDFIYFEGHAATHCVSSIISVAEYKSQLDVIVGDFYTGSYYGQMFIQYVDETTLKVRAVHTAGNWTCHILSIYGIKTNSSYSTEEQLIGTWIDGKPLYQKTFTGSMPTTGSSHNIDISTLGVDTVYDVSGMIKYVDGVLFAINNPNGSEYVVTIITYDSNISNKRINISWGSGVSFLSTSKYYITIRYTKT